MLNSLDTQTRKIGLFLNDKKTEAMLENQENETTIKSKSGKILKVNFKYLGGWIHSTSKDFEVRKALYFYMDVKHEP